MRPLRKIRSGKAKLALLLTRVRETYAGQAVSLGKQNADLQWHFWEVWHPGLVDLPRSEWAGIAVRAALWMVVAPVGGGLVT